MSFNTAPGRAEYTASAAQTDFTFPFKIYNTSDVKVYLTPTGQTADDATDILIETTDYTVTINGDNGGDVTLTSGATLNDAVTLVRDLPVDRDTEYQQSGDLTAAALNEDQDYQTYLILDGSLKTNERALIVPDSAQDFDTTLPAPGADKMFIYAADGKSINLIDPSNTDFFKEAFIVNSMQALLGVDEATYGSVNVRGYSAISDGGGGFFDWNSAIDKSTANAGTVFDPSVSLANQGTGVGNGCWVRQYSGAVNALWFISDKNSDSTEDIRRCHTYANSISNSVTYAGLEEAKITADAQISVNTNIDFDGCKIRILNGVIVSPDWDIVNILYTIEDPNCPLVRTSGLVSSSNLKAGSRFPTKDVYDGIGYALLTSTFQIPNREKDGEVSYTQSFNVGHEAYVSQPLSADLSAHTSVTVDYRNLSTSKVVISNVSVINDGWNNQAIINIERCNVQVINFTSINESHDPGFNNVDRLIWINNASDIVLDNIVANGRSLSPGGSYVIGIYGGADILINNANSGGYLAWGSTGCNNLNGVRYTNCYLNRYDVHSSGHNIFIDNCSIGKAGVRYGWGGGIIKITNSNSVANVLANRGDYSGQFFGTLIVDGLSIQDTSTSTLTVVNLANYDGIGASTPIYAPNVIVKNITREARDGYNKQLIPINIKVLDALSVVYSPEYITVENIYCFESWQIGTIIDWLNFELRPLSSFLEFTLTNAKASFVPASTGGITEHSKIVASTNQPRLNIKIRDVKSLFIKCTLPEKLVMHIEDSEPCGIVIDTVSAFQPNIDIVNCTHRFPISGISPTVFGGILSGAIDSTRINGFYILADDVDLSNISASIGLLVKASFTTVTLPATATFDTMYTGFKVAQFK